MKTVSESQIAFGKRIGLDLDGKSVAEARAMIEDAIQRDFAGDQNLGTPTEKQIEFAAKFQHNISNLSRRVGDAIVSDLMMRLNAEAINREGLAPGVKVINRHDPLQRELTISSIAEDGTVYFRGGNGARAWARSLIRTTT